MMRDGNAARFLAWVQDPGQAPVDAPAGDSQWTRLVHDAFAYAAQRHARSVSDDAAARLACRPGCDWCCHIPVTTTPAEVAVAWRHAQAHLSTADLETVKARAARTPGAAPAPCPFLLDHRCGVYPVRPLACRAWNSTDAGACERAHALGHDRVAIPVLTLSRGVFANAAQALARGIAERGGEPAVSLRAALAVLARDAGEAADDG